MEGVGRETKIWRTRNFPDEPKTEGRSGQTGEHALSTDKGKTEEKERPLKTVLKIQAGNPGQIGVFPCDLLGLDPALAQVLNNFMNFNPVACP